MATSAPKTAPKLVKGSGAAKPDGEDAAPVAKKKSKKKAILMGGIVAIVLGGAAAGAYIAVGTGDKPAASADPNAPQEEAKKSEPAKPPLFVPVEPFTVNLQHENSGDQFLQVSFTLQLADQKQEELFKLYQPQARSRLLLLLSGKRASEISTVEGKRKLAEDIVATLKVPFTEQGASLDIKDVFFTSFVIQ
jgi:flagellar FliL protein